MLNLTGVASVILGGGSVAVRRAKSLVEAGAQVTVIAPSIDHRLTAMNLEKISRPYQTGDLAGARLIVIATDNPQVNAAAAAEARQVGAWINRADDPAAGDFTVPAHARRGPVTVAVDTGGVSPGAAAAIRDGLLAALDPHWPQLLELVAPYRDMIKAVCPDAKRRRGFLQRLTDSTIIDSLKQNGPGAVIAACERIAAEAGKTIAEN